MATTVADQLADVLLAAGVKRIYGIVGDSLNGLTDALRRQGKIEWVHVRHEEVAAFAAGAEAHLTGELAVCAGSCGPGNLHLINGLFDCHRSRVPVLAIAAQIPSAEIGSRLFPGNASARRCSRSAATIASWSPAPTRCRACSRSRSARRSASAASRCVVHARRRRAATRVRRAARPRSRPAARAAGHDARRSACSTAWPRCSTATGA